MSSVNGLPRVIPKNDSQWIQIGHFAVNTFYSQPKTGDSLNDNFLVIFRKLVRK